MGCTVVSVVLFLVASILYGSSFAIVQLGIDSFTAGFFQFMRMMSGAFCCGIMIVIRCFTKSGYKHIVKMHFTSGIMPLVHIFIGGLMNLGVPHCMITIAQKWIPTAMVNIAQPLTSVSGALFSLCINCKENKIHWRKGIALILNVMGVIIPMIAVLGKPNEGVTIQEVIVGCVLLILAVALFGIALVYFEWKVPNADPTVSCFIQLLTSGIVDIIFTLCYDGPKELQRTLSTAAPIMYLWPIIVGVLVGFVALQLVMMLITMLGSTLANLITIGQLIVGVIIGVAFYNEWAHYSVSDIALNIVGILLFILAIVFTVLDDNQNKRPDEMDEEEEGSDMPIKMDDDPMNDEELRDIDEL